MTDFQMLPVRRWRPRFLNRKTVWLVGAKWRIDGQKTGEFLIWSGKPGPQEFVHSEFLLRMKALDQANG